MSTLQEAKLPSLKDKLFNQTDEPEVHTEPEIENEEPEIAEPEIVEKPAKSRLKVGKNKATKNKKK